MKRLTAILFAALCAQPAFAATVTGIDFIDIADVLDGSVGRFDSNSGNGVDSVVDGNAASYIYSDETPASVDVSFGGGLFDTGEVDLTILFVGADGHAGTVTLLGGTSGGGSTGFSIVANDESYTGYNSQPASLDESEECIPENDCYGIFAATIDLSGFSGTFGGVSLDISGSSAAPSLLGTTASVTAVPVPAAVWLFGSGLLGLIGVARKARSA